MPNAVLVPEEVNPGESAAVPVAVVELESTPNESSVGFKSDDVDELKSVSISVESGVKLVSVGPVAKAVSVESNSEVVSVVSEVCAVSVSRLSSVVLLVFPEEVVIFSTLIP